MNLDEVRARFDAPAKGNAKCPNHDDKRASLSINPKDDGGVKMHCHAGCDTADVLRQVGLTFADLGPPETNGHKVKQETLKYPYHNATGHTLYNIVRTSDKQFRADRSVPLGARVPYHLPEILKAKEQGDWIFVVEGEKDAERLRSHGLVATCNPFGAGKWIADWAPYFDGAYVVIIPDNDEPGREHAHDVHRKLYGYAEQVRILDLPGLPDKGDVSDWLDAGHTVDELLQNDAETTHNEEPPDTWWPLDLTPYLNGDQVNDPPTILHRTDGKTALIYPGLVHALYGEPESGKSWLALAGAAEQLNAGQTVLYLDFEDSPGRIIARLRSLGVHDDAIHAYFRYSRPTEPYPDSARRMLDTYQPTLVILDAITEAMTVDGLNAFTGADKDYPEWHSRVVRPFATTGAAVLLLDHVVKNRDTRGRWAAGSQHKLAALDGAGYSLDTIEPFGINREGYGKLVISKDRPGHVRQFQAAQNLIADVKMTQISDRVIVELTEPTAEGDKIERLIIDHLSETPGLPGNKTEIVKAIGKQRAAVFAAINALEDRGVVDVMPGGPGKPTLVMLRSEMT